MAILHLVYGLASVVYSQAAQIESFGNFKNSISSCVFLFIMLILMLDEQILFCNFIKYFNTEWNFGLCRPLLSDPHLHNATIYYLIHVLNIPVHACCNMPCYRHAQRAHMAKVYLERKVAMLVPSWHDQSAFTSMRRLTKSSMDLRSNQMCQDFGRMNQYWGNTHQMSM